MEFGLLTQVTGILGPFAFIMGKILNGIYEFLSLFGIENLALCIILFTIVIKMLMLPLTIKQQKGTRLSSKMNPEIQKVQAKYKGKKDQASMQKQQMEMQEIYQKYGTSPLAGCLPLLISFPIMIALYQIIYRIPAYVNDINSLYSTVAIQFQSIDGYADALKQFLANNEIAASIGKLAEMSGDSAKKLLIDIFSKFNTSSWNAFKDAAGWLNADGTASVFTSADALNQFKQVIANPDVTNSIDQIMHANRLVGSLNILDTPKIASITVIIPILSGVLQFVQSKLMMAVSSNGNQKQPGQDTMKTMNTVMPIVSAGFCLFMPIGVGIYWIASSAVLIVQQIFINNYFNKIDIDELIEQNVAKSNKKKEKLGVGTGNRMAEVAKTSTKTIQAPAKPANNKKAESSNYKKSDVSYSAGSISANANILKRNSDKGDN